MFKDTKPLFEFRGPWGVPVQVCASLILFFLVFVDFSGTPRSFAFDVMFVAILIGSIYLHELGHAWGCLIQGVSVGRLVLNGGGGFCEPSRSSTRYEKELIVAMGPIVNLFLWAVAGLIAPWISDPEINWVFRTIAWVNGFLFLLNMLPVHPLDGGKLLELILCRVLPIGVAVSISATLGLLLAIVWIPLMVWTFVNIGVVLFFLPSVRQHWQMLRGVKA